MSLIAPHIGFVFAAYGFSALVLGALIFTALWQARRTSVRLAELEERQAARRKPAKQVRT